MKIHPVVFVGDFSNTLLVCAIIKTLTFKPSRTKIIDLLIEPRLLKIMTHIYVIKINIKKKYTATVR